MQINNDSWKFNSHLTIIALIFALFTITEETSCGIHRITIDVSSNGKVVLIALSELHTLNKKYKQKNLKALFDFAKENQATILAEDPFSTTLPEIAKDDSKTIKKLFRKYLKKQKPYIHKDELFLLDLIHESKKRTLRATLSIAG